MKKVLMKLDTLNKLASAINTKLAPRKYRIKELPKAVDDVFSKELEAVRKEYREFLYGPKSVFSDPYGKFGAIKEFMFANRNDLIELTFPKVTYLGINAFENCRNLRKITFPICSRVDGDVFLNCISLEEINGFPGGSYRFEGIFKNCINLRSVSLDWADIPWSTFDGCEKLEIVNLPSATYMSECAFQKCYNLKSISIPLITLLGGCDFESCISLEEISLPECERFASIPPMNTTGGGNNFEGCINLKSIYAPKLKTTQAREFYGCSKLENVYMPLLQSINQQMFWGCIGLRSIPSTSFPNVSVIYAYAFQNCASLEYAEFINGYLPPDFNSSIFADCVSLKSIRLLGNNSRATVSPAAFYNCYNLVSIEYLHATMISDHAFYNCSKLSYVSFPECSIICANAFENCIALSSVDMDNVDSILPYAFLNCHSLSQAIFSQCLHLGYGAFANCTNLKEIEMNAISSFTGYMPIPNTENAFWTLYSSDMPYGIFYGCSNLKTAKLLNLSATAAVGRGMFENCIQLENVFLSSLFSNVASRMFYNCQALSSIDIPECATIYPQAFMNCSSLESIDFPKCSQIYSQVFMNCTALSYVNIPSCTYLSDSVFQNCRSLVSIELFSAAPGTNIYDGSGNQYQTSCTIASNCFQDCINLRTVSIAELSYIRLDIYRHAFRNCLSLESFITNADGILIGDFIFDHCSSLSIISCPNMFINGHYVFANCTGVEEIHIGTVMHAFQYSNPWPYNYRHTFANCINLKRLYIMGLFVPYRDYNSMFDNCNFLEEGDLYVPSSRYNQYLYSSGNWLSVMDESRIHPI